MTGASLQRLASLSHLRPLCRETYLTYPGIQGFAEIFFENDCMTAESGGMLQAERMEWDQMLLPPAPKTESVLHLRRASVLQMIHEGSDLIAHQP